jgi:chemotaxis protein methyltransferase CheR
MNLTDQHFDQVRDLALQLAGIELRDRHRDLFCTRIRRIGICETTQIDAMLRRVKDREPEATNSFIGLVTTKHTSFFRHPFHFEEATRHAIWVVEKRRRALIWCAGAATGEEPFSLAMRLLEAFKPQPVPVSIIATDVDPAAVGFARGGQYGDLALRSLTAERRERFFQQTSQGRGGLITSSVRDLVEFQVLNLIWHPWPLTGPVDLIFCRNVLMYLEANYRLTVLRSFASLLAPDGLLVLDPAEHLGPGGNLFTLCCDGVYASRRVGFSPNRALPVPATVGL